MSSKVFKHTDKVNLLFVVLVLVGASMNWTRGELRAFTLEEWTPRTIYSIRCSLDDGQYTISVDGAEIARGRISEADRVAIASSLFKARRQSRWIDPERCRGSIGLNWVTFYRDDKSPEDFPVWIGSETLTGPHFRWKNLAISQYEYEWRQSLTGSQSQ